MEIIDKWNNSNVNNFVFDNSSWVIINVKYHYFTFQFEAGSMIGTFNLKKGKVVEWNVKYTHLKKVRNLNTISDMPEELRIALLECGYDVERFGETYNGK